MTDRRGFFSLLLGGIGALLAVAGSTFRVQRRSDELDEFELLVLDQVDSEGDIISGEDFPAVDGLRLPLRRAFSTTEPLGMATLRRDGNRIMARVRFGEGKRPTYPFELAVGCNIKPLEVGERSSTGASHAAFGIKPRVVHVADLWAAGLVPMGQKVK